MKRYSSKLLTLLMAVIMIMAFSIAVNAESLLEDDYTGKTVILSTNDVHGAVEGYAYVAGLRELLESRGADVITVDAGDFSQGTTYVSESKGMSAVQLMNLAGYDYSTLGNHEFDFGPDALEANVEAAEFDVLCADMLLNETDEFKYAPADMYEDEESGLKIGFIGMATPETQTKALPSNFTSMHFPHPEQIWPLTQEIASALKEHGADVIVCLAHLGVDDESEPYRSYDLFYHTELIDIILDGHSHTVMEKGVEDEPIMSTGTKLVNVGVTVIDENSQAIEKNFLYPLRATENDPFTDEITPDPDVKEAADALIEEVDAAYGQTVAVSDVELNGERSVVDGVYGNRDGETNLGDLITDAMRWYVLKDGADLGVDDNHIVTITNGGGIRAPLHKGDITKSNIKTVLPFGNTIAAVTVTGAELLEALEASTYSLPGSVGGFPQIEGMKISISRFDTYDKNPEPYPGSTYYGPASINRVTIDSVNDKPFNPDDTYVVLTNNFCAEGGDTYYVFKNATNQFDTGIALDYALTDYIVEHLNGKIDDTYAEPQGRITYVSSPSGVENIVNALPSEITEADEAAVELARAEYDALTEEEKSDFPEEALIKLEAAEAKLEAIHSKAKTEAIIKLATDLVDAVTEDIKEADYTKSTYDAYDAAFKSAYEILKDEKSSTAQLRTADADFVAAKGALVKKGDQPMKVTPKKMSFKAKKIKKKAGTIKAKNAFALSGAEGKVTYKKTSGNKKITVSSSGNVTIKKGTKKGKYTASVKVTAAGNDNFKPGFKTVKITVVVK